MLCYDTGLLDDKRKMLALKQSPKPQLIRLPETMTAGTAVKRQKTAAGPVAHAMAESVASGVI